MLRYPRVPCYLQKGEDVPGLWQTVGLQYQQFVSAVMHVLIDYMTHSDY